MDTVLIAVAIVALAAAAGMAVMLGRLVREERHRSDARVAALAEMSAEGPRSPERQETNHVGRVSPGTAILATSTTEDPAGLFAEHEPASPWRRRWAVIGALSILLATGVLLASRSHMGPTPAGTGPATPAQPARLELLSMQYDRQADRMTISGLVRNPASGSTLVRLAATAFLFGADGTFLASGRAPLDFTKLAPGDESGFVITIPVTGAVARYRVGFRDEDGRVIAHVDRRAAATLAKRDPVGGTP